MPVKSLQVAPCNLQNEFEIKLVMIIIADNHLHIGGTMQLTLKEQVSWNPSK
jgi:hypothetical protein